MKLIILSIENEGMTKNMMVEKSTPSTISLRTSLRERGMDQSSLKTRNLTPCKVKS